jgi:hypothetical protein
MSHWSPRDCHEADSSAAGAVLWWRRPSSGVGTRTSSRRDTGTIIELPCPTALHPQISIRVRSPKTRYAHNSPQGANKPEHSRYMYEQEAQHAASLQPHQTKLTSHRRALERRRGTQSTHSCSLADVCLPVGTLARAVACGGGLCWHGVTSGRHVMTNMWGGPEGQRGSSLYESERRASPTA